MNNTDKDLKNFFAQMQKADNDIQIPEFETLYPAKQRFVEKYRYALGIAASVLLVLSIYLITNGKSEVQQEKTFEIVLIGPEESGTQSFIYETSGIESWEATSDYLIDDFIE